MTEDIPVSAGEQLLEGQPRLGVKLLGVEVMGDDGEGLLQVLDVQVAQQESYVFEIVKLLTLHDLE